MSKFFTAVTTILIVTSGDASAGIKFSDMPIGCSWTTRYSSGQINTETFTGRKNGAWHTVVVDFYNPSNVIRNSYFDDFGRLIKKDWGGGKVEYFRPFSCFGEVQSCEFEYSNGDGTKGIIVNSTIASGKGFSVNSGFKSGTQFEPEYFELGPFNMMVLNRSSNYSAVTLEFDNCGALQS